MKNLFKLSLGVLPIGLFLVREAKKEEIEKWFNDEEFKQLNYAKKILDDGKIARAVKYYVVIDGNTRLRTFRDLLRYETNF